MNVDIYNLIKMSKLVGLLFLFTSILVFGTVIPTEKDYDAKFGYGDWSVYPYWILSEWGCFEFVDHEAYELGRIHAIYDPVKKYFGFQRQFNVSNCVTIAAQLGKNVIIHLNQALEPSNLRLLEKIVGVDFESVWIHYELPANWTGQLYIAPFHTVVLSLLEEEVPTRPYNAEMLQILTNRLKQFNGEVCKAIQLDTKMVKLSKKLDFQPVIRLVQYTILYQLEKSGENKEDILHIVKSPIPFSIWDVAFLEMVPASASSNKREVGKISKIFGRR